MADGCCRRNPARGAFVLNTDCNIAAIVIVSNLLTSWAYQQSGELMEVKRENAAVTARKR